MTKAVNIVTYLSNGMRKCLHWSTLKTTVSNWKRHHTPPQMTMCLERETRRERDERHSKHRGLERGMMSPCATASGHQNVLNDCWPDPRLDALLST